MYPMEITDKLAQPVLTMHTRTHVQALPGFLGHAYNSIAAYLSELGEEPAGPPFAAYYNMDMENLDVEAGFPAKHELPAKGEILFGYIPAGEQAACLYSGPYNECGRAYEALAAYIKQQGREPTGVAYEFYLNSPDEAPPEELMTRIVFPLK